jgi:hypothetical protein
MTDDEIPLCPWCGRALDVYCKLDEAAQVGVLRTVWRVRCRTPHCPIAPESRTAYDDRRTLLRAWKARGMGRPAEDLGGE